MIPARRPLVKICGVTSVEDALAAVELGADLVGLNFWPGSPRHVELVRAREIAAAVGGRATLVGVFVDEAPARITALVAAIGLDLVQLHGDEAPEIVERLTAPILRVFRGLPSMESFSVWKGVIGFLVDAGRPGSYGGSGESWDYSSLRSLPRDGRPLLVAGGIRPENVGAALLASGADGVDVASGVESAPGVKDRDKMRRLFEEMRRVPR